MNVTLAFPAITHVTRSRGATVDKVKGDFGGQRISGETEAAEA